MSDSKWRTPFVSVFAAEFTYSDREKMQQNNEDNWPSRLAHKSSFWARSATVSAKHERAKATTPDQKTKRTTLRKSTGHNEQCRYHDIEWHPRTLSISSDTTHYLYWYDIYVSSYRLSLYFEDVKVGI